LEVLSDVQQTAKEGKVVWWGNADRLFVAKLVSTTETDAATLRNTLNTLKSLEDYARTSYNLRPWWHEACVLAYEKLGETESALEHARLWVQTHAKTELYQQERAVDFLTRLLRECGRLEEAESVLRGACEESCVS
jgi:hypothetical protein